MELVVDGPGAAVPLLRFEPGPSEPEISPLGLTAPEAEDDAAAEVDEDFTFGLLWGFSSDAKATVGLLRPVGLLGLALPLRTCLGLALPTFRGLAPPPLGLALPRFLGLDIVLFLGLEQPSSIALLASLHSEPPTAPANATLLFTRAAADLTEGAFDLSLTGAVLQLSLGLSHPPLGLLGLVKPMSSFLLLLLLFLGEAGPAPSSPSPSWLFLEPFPAFKLSDRP